MELFYLNEHTSCYNYSKSMQEGFRYYKFDEGLNHEEELVKDCILFVLKGSLQFSCNGFQFTVSSGEMVFFCRTTVSLFTTSVSESAITGRSGPFACDCGFTRRISESISTLREVNEPTFISGTNENNTRNNNVHKSVLNTSFK